MAKREISIIVMFISGVLFSGCSTINQSQAEREKRVQSSPHYIDGKFVNPIEAPLMAPGSTWKYIKKSLFGSRTDPKPTGELPVREIRAQDWAEADEEDLYFSWLGHSSILIAVDGKTILVDPVLEKRASPFTWIGPKRFHPAPVTAGALPPVDVVLITHDHYDHLEKSTMKQLGSTAGLFLVPLGIGQLLEDWGISPDKIAELDWWENHSVGSLNFTATPAVHYAGRGLFDGKERLWCSWAVNGKNKNIFVSGDSGYFDGFKKVGEKLGPFDVTLLKIGASDDMWKQIHLTPEEAVQQHQDLGGGVLVPLHWATFDLGLHPWYEPMERLVAEAREKDARFITPEIGQQIDFNRLPEVNPWWRGVDKNQE